MSHFTNMAERANVIFGCDNIKNVDAEIVNSAKNFVDLAKQLKIAVSADEVSFLETWPLCIQGCLLATVREAIAAENRIPIAVAWAPDYDYSFSIWDTRATHASTRGISVLLRSRYPDDLALYG